jgi:putative transposase
MPKPYSNDLRTKIVDAYQRGEGTQRGLAERFGVSGTFVVDLLRRFRQTGSVEPKPRGGGQQPRLDANHLEVVTALVKKDPDATLDEMIERVAEQTGVRVSNPTMSRVLTRLNLPRKKSRSTPASATPRAFRS